MALRRRNPQAAMPALLGITTGIGVLSRLTFAHVDVGSWDAGLIALAPNLAVTLVAHLLWPRRPLAESAPEHADRAPRKPKPAAAGV